MTRIRSCLGGVFVVLCAVSCSNKPDSAKLDVVRISTHGRLSNSVIFIAEEEGYFASEGIRLHYVEPPRSTQVLPLLERGDVDVLGAQPSAGLYSGFQRGARFKIVADRGHLEASGCDYDGIMGRKESFTSDSPSADEMRGKRFSINQAGTAAYISDMYLESLGLTQSDMKIVKLNETVEAQAIEAGSLDGMHVAEPYLSKLRSMGHRLIARGGRLAPGAHMSLLVFGPSIVVDNRELGQRFMNAYLRGARQYAEGATPRNIEIIAKRTGFDATLLRTVCLPKISADGELSLGWLLDFQKWAVRKGYLERVLGREAGTDLSFARRAAATWRAEGSRK